MPPGKEKDPWSRSFVSSPSPSPSSDADDDVLPTSGFIDLQGHNDLANELDLSRREDLAIVKETPFTLARLRAQHQASKGDAARAERGARMGGSIRTAEGTDDPPSSSTKATGNAPKKRRVANTGWTDSDGGFLTAGPIRKGGKRGTSHEVTGPTSKPAFKAPAKKTSVKAAAKGAKGKKATKKKADENKIEFRRLPAVTPDSNFPIVAALERQRSLPPKKKPAKKAVAPSPRSGPSKPKQTKLNIDALVGGLSYKPKGKKKPFTPPSIHSPSTVSTGDPTDLSAALNKRFGDTPGAFLPPKPVAIPEKRPRSPPARSDFGELQDQYVDLTRSNSGSTLDEDRLQQLGQPAVSPTTISILQPAPKRASVVNHLEMLAEEHDFDSIAQNQTAASDRQVTGPNLNEFNGHRGESGLGPSLPRPRMRDVEAVRLAQRKGYRYNDSQECMEAEGAQWDEVKERGRDGQASPGGDVHPGHGPHDSAWWDGDGLERVANGYDDQPWQHDNGSAQNGSRHDPPWLHDDEPVINTGPDQTWLHRGAYGEAVRAPTRLLSLQPSTFTPGAFYESDVFHEDRFHREPVQRTAPSSSRPAEPRFHSLATQRPDPILETRHSPLSAARHPPTPASAYTSSRQRPLAGSWHEVLRSPSPTAWSTLPQSKRRNRLTIRPEAREPKASRSFRLPLNIFAKPEPAHAARQPSPPRPAEDPGLYTGPVTITKWTPTALRQPAASASSSTDGESERRRDYVPPAMRALNQATADGGYLASAASRPSHFAHPHNSHTAPHNSHPTQSNPYMTPKSLAPTLAPTAFSGPVEDDNDDDWAAAWTLSANGKKRMSAGY